MHNAAFRHLGMNAVYLACDVRPEELAAALRGMAALGFGGANVTIPHKEAAARLVDRRDEAAELTGAVNTVLFTASGLLGCNTDLTGFLTAVQEAFGQSPAGQKVLLLGAGGAGRAVAFGCVRAGAAAVLIRDVDQARATALAEEVRSRAAGVEVRTVTKEEIPEAAAAAELIVNATPLGMKETDRPPLESAWLHAGQRVYDLVYVRPVTPLMQAAAAAGAQAANGLGMLLHQGAQAFRLWTGREPPLEVMREALESAVYGRGGQKP